MFQSEKKPDNNPVNKNQENAKATANSRHYYTIMQQQNRALNSINASVQLKEEEKEDPLQAKEALVQRMVKEEEEKPAQAKMAPAQMIAMEEEEGRKTQMKQGGEETGTDQHSTPVFSKMNQAIQEKMESSFGTGFSDVNIIQNDPSAKHIGALAYTQGKDVHFVPGQYNPDTQTGQELLGHELTHIVQQKQDRVQPTNTAYAKASSVKEGKEMAVNDNPSLESEADNIGKKAANGQSVDVVGKSSGVQKQDEDMENNEAENNIEETLPTTLGLSGSVGKDCTNSDADVLIVKNKLIEYGFLESSEATQNQINDAIGEFQKEVLNYSKPDKQISAGGSTERAMTTYFSPIKTKSDYETIANNQKDITIKTTKVNDNFKTDFSGIVISSASNATNIDLNALISLRLRLNDFGNSFVNDTLTNLLNTEQSPLNDQQKKQIDDSIKETIEKLKTLQNSKNIKWWSNKKSNIEPSIFVLSGTTTQPDYTEGQIEENDATYLYLANHKKHQMEWTLDDNSKKTLVLSNMVKSDHTTNLEGLSYVGTEKPSAMAEDDFKEASCLSDSKNKALMEASSHEGNFDAINTYDKAKVSIGFIQFAGGNRSFEYLLARLKLEKPTIFHNYFGNYGIDVEFRTDNNDKIKSNSCRIVVHDPKEETTYRGLEAEDFMSSNAFYSALLIKAGSNSEIKKMQVKIATEKYANTSENETLDLTIKALKVSEDGINGPKTLEGESEISDYKKTDEYSTNNENNHITEIDLDLQTLKIGEIMQSEKELAALYGTYINVPGWSVIAIQRAVKEIVIRNGLTTIDQVKSIDPTELLKSMKENSYHYNKNKDKVIHTNHQNRIQSAIDSKLSD